MPNDANLDEAVELVRAKDVRSIAVMADIRDEAALREARASVESVRKLEGAAFMQANEALSNGGYNAMDIAFLEPIEIGHAVAFLASPRAAFITGEIVDVAVGANIRWTA